MFHRLRVSADQPGAAESPQDSGHTELTAGATEEGDDSQRKAILSIWNSQFKSVASNFSSNIGDGHFVSYTQNFKRNFVFLDTWIILKIIRIKSDFIHGWLTTENIFP